MGDKDEERRVRMNVRLSCKVSYFLAVVFALIARLKKSSTISGDEKSPIQVDRDILGRTMSAGSL